MTDHDQPKLADIVKGQKLVALAERETVQQACRYMCERRTGSVLVLDDEQRLTGIFTGRDAVRALTEGKNAEETTLAHAMTPNPITINPDNRAIDALREMSNRGFRHLPVVESGRIWGVVSGVIAWGWRSTGWMTKPTYGNASADGLV